MNIRSNSTLKLKGSNDSAITENTGSASSKIETLISRLKNPGEATFLLVAYPEFTPLHESFRAMKDLERVGIQSQGVFLNHILNDQDCTDDFSMERWKLQQHYLYKASELYSSKPLFAIPLQSAEIIGIEQVKTLSEKIFNN
ncbi:MAG: arsenical pump-driving ATPase GET3 [Ignavibacteriales bacterium]|nr:arsenical pump-driving ATPase GET3 [Ignavibacteriales bacterium]